jgi:putative ABC transport system substrate-binding protein
MAINIGRRQIIFAIGGATVAWPLAARAQTSAVRQIGVLMGWSESDADYRSRLDAFSQGLAQLGWVEGRNYRIVIRWTNGDIDRARAFARELVDLQPDVILSGTTHATAALHRETLTIPIVFAVVSDPVGAGFVASLSRPGGNITGFLNIEATMGGKWLDLLKEVAPNLAQVAIMFNPDTAPGGGSYFLSAFETAARSLAVKTTTARIHSDAEIETTIISLGQEHAGLVVMNDAFMDIHRSTVISAAARNSVPAIFDTSFFAREGGLISYGPNYPEFFRQAASYVDRILKGVKPSDLPVQAPTKFDLLINLKTAKALGLDVPPTLLARADELIE